MHLKYEVIIYWSVDDQAFLAEPPELPGCMADCRAHGEALRNLETIMAEWIETARDLGRPVPEPLSRLLVQTERRVMDQFAARLSAVERQGLNHLGGTASYSQAGKGSEAEPAIVGGIPHQRRAPARRPQAAEGFCYQGRADPLAMP